MIAWEADARTLRVTDADNAEVIVRGTDFSVAETDHELPRPVDETLAVTARRLEFPHAIVYVHSRSSGEQYELEPDGDPLSLPADEYVVDVDTVIKSYLEFSGPATIEPTPESDTVVVSFPDRTRLHLGLRSRHELPSATITVPDSPRELATALSYTGSSHKTSNPNRSYPTLRGHPPLFESGDTLEIPSDVRAETPDPGIELHVPPRYEALYVVAPLAYYLQATVRTIDSRSGEPPTPTLRIPELGIEEPLSPLPGLERDVQQLLRTVFFMDCLVRNAGPYGTSLAELSLLDALELDAERLYDATPERRLATYLEVPFSAIEHRLPDWHLSTYVAPEYDRLEALPFLLDRLSLIYPPSTSELEGRELVKRSLDDFYRGRDGDSVDGRSPAGTPMGTVGATRASTRQVASVDVVKPELRHGRVHGWLADGVPIDVFKSTVDAYENRLEYIERESDETSIHVVLNDPEMAGEHADVADIYRQRSETLPISVSVEELLRTDELARVFESEHDFVHYIGHCETDGLQCSDGYLSTSSIDQCNVQTFFLNACGSFYEGRSLVERGSVAGAVTFTQVLNEHAVKVGSTFAKLLVHGFSIERALRLARRRIMMGKDYAVVGDGTYSLTHGDHQVPTTITIEPLSEGDRYLVTYNCYSTRVTGSYYVPHTEDNEYAYLCGRQSHFTLSSSELASLLEETEASVVYDGDLYWSTDLSTEFDR
ncbi:hypothetical protein [Halopiger goleimassiliensis]|uniref:hypothetical protein n=1 Tax=Halopiger goleimassiliensis TaxID=1293048 RepID=UPI000677FD94|nr:hypothetical protein [Halopiger goleimassiliensis]